MKLRHLFMAVIASAFAFTACEEEIDLGVAKLSIDPLELTFGPEGATKSVTMVATRDWFISGELPDWIAVSPSSGQADVKEQTVTVTVLENKGNDRETNVSFTIGTYRAALTVKQEGALGELNNGTGTKEDPYTVAGVIAYLNELGNDVNSPEKVFIKGKVSSVAKDKSDVEQYFSNTGTYGNATFFISDDGSENDQFECYRILYLGNKKFVSGDTDIKLGDDVVIYGNVVNYKGNTPETVQGSAFLYSLNGVDKGGDETQQTGNYGDPAGSGTKEDPYNVSKAHTLAAALDSEGKIENVYVKGIISKVDEINTQYGNGTFYIVDKGFEGDLEIYRAYGLGGAKFTSADDIKAGDEVIMYGTLVNFKGNTIEMTQGGQIYSLNGKTAGGDTPQDDTMATPAGKGTADDPFNVARAIEKAKSTGETATTEEYYIKGKVSKVVDGFGANTYGNGTYDLVDDGYTAKFTAFRIYYFNGQKWQEGDKTIKEGDEIVVVGKIVNYKGNTPETNQGGSLYSINGETGGEEPPVTEEVKSVSIAQFLAAAESSTQPYKLSGKLSNLKNTTYGNFDLVDAEGSSVYVYGLTATNLGYGASNDKSFASLNLAEGDMITIIGYRGSYNGSPQVVSAYFVEKTGGEEPPVTEVITATIAEFNDAAESDTQKYQLTGKISNLANTTYGNFDLVDETGTVYVYGLTATDLGYGSKNDKSFESLKLAEGDVITIIGYRGSYNGKIEVLNAYFVEKTGSEEPPVTGEIIQATVAEFNAAAESDTQKYQLTGKISNLANTTYGNFDLVDETGTVYVYGLTATDLGYGSKNDKSFESLKLAEGDVITIIGYRGSYNGKIEVLNAYFVEKVSSGASEDPYLTVKSISQTSTRGFTVTWETNVKSGTYFAWSLYRKTTEVEDGVAYAAMGRGTDMTTTSLNVYDGSADGAGWYEDLIPGETYYFAINFYDYSVSGDDPVVANDPEKAFFEAKDMTNPGTLTEVTINLTNATTFAADNGGDTLKNGFAATVAGWKVATYQYKSTSAPVTPDEYSMRVYKSAVFYIEAPDGVEIKSLVFKANNYSSGKYILDMTGVEGTSGTALADKSMETITWEASSPGITKVILQAAAGQTRLESVTVKY